MLKSIVHLVHGAGYKHGNHWRKYMEDSHNDYKRMLEHHGYKQVESIVNYPPLIPQ